MANIRFAIFSTTFALIAFYSMAPVQNQFIRLKQSVHRLLVGDILITCLVFISGTVLVYLGIVRNTDPPVFFTVAGCLLLIISMFSLNYVYKFYRHEQLIALHILQNRSDHIVWCYYSKLNLMPFGVGVLSRCRFFIYNLNGEMYNLRASENSIKQIIKHLQKMNPAITVGYSVNNEQLYKADPHLLRND